MKSLLVGYSLFIAFFVGVITQRIPDYEPIGRRGDVLTLGDVSDQTVFNVDNSGGKGGGSGGGGSGGGGSGGGTGGGGGSGGGGGKGGGGGSGGGGGKPALDCAKIIHDCQCNGIPAPGPNPTGQYQMDYDSYPDGYNNG